MKIAKSMVLMAIGAGAVLAYQKYSEPLMNKLEDVTDDILNKANKKLDSMTKGS